MAKIEISIIREIVLKSSLIQSMENMPIWIIVFLFYYKMFLSKITGLNSASLWFRVSLDSFTAYQFFSSKSPTEITEKLSEWVSQGQLMDTTMTISKLEYVDRTRQLNIVCGVNSIQDWRKSTKIFSPRKLLFSFCHYEWLYDSFFLYKIREKVQFKVGLFYLSILSYLLNLFYLLW